MVLAEQEGRGRQLLAQTFLQSSPEFFSLQLTKQSSEVGASCSLVTRREEEKKVEVKKRGSRWEENEQEHRSVLITSMKEGKIKGKKRFFNQVQFFVIRLKFFFISRMEFHQ